MGISLGFVVQRQDQVAAKCLGNLDRPVVFPKTGRAVGVGLVHHEGLALVVEDGLSHIEAH